MDKQTDGDVEALAALRSLDCAEIVSAMDRDGLYCAKGIVSSAELAQLRATVQSLASERGNRSFTIGYPGNQIAAIAKVSHSQAVIDTLRDVACRALDTQSIRNSRLRDVLRVIVGRPAARPFVFTSHYDAALITALVPIFIPDGAPEEAGDFVCMPNRRGVRKSAAINYLEKGLAQSGLARRRFGRLVRQRDKSVRIVKLEPGNVYFFYGYRTYHGNCSSAAGTLRATLLLHYGDPHLTSPLRRISLAYTSRLRDRLGLSKLDVG